MVNKNWKMGRFGAGMRAGVSNWQSKPYKIQTQTAGAGSLTVQGAPLYNRANECSAPLAVLQMNEGGTHYGNDP